MIQDIAPHRYDNAFQHKRAPLPADRVLPVRGGKIFLRKEEEISYLSAEDLLCRLGRESLPEEAAADEQTEKRGRRRLDGEDGTYLLKGIPLIFLFLVDETAFYGVEDPRVLEQLADTFPDFSWEPATELRTAVPREMAFAGVTGMQLARWRSDRKFCGGCGGRMRPSRTERAFVCTSCDAVVYPKISPAVIVAVTQGDRILLTKYAGRTFTRYALIAGFTEIGETVEQTVAREVMEEVGLKVKNLRYYKSQPWSFTDTLLLGFFCDLDGDEAITLDESELAVGAWMRREEMPDRSGDISLTGEMMEQFRLGREPR